MKIIAVTTTVIVLCGIVIACGGLHSWEHNRSVDGVSYERVRFEEIKGAGRISIGKLSKATNVNGLTYSGWLHRRENGSVLGGMLQNQTVINQVTIPAGTWISFSSEGRLKACHFPSDQSIQDHTCRGSGQGAKGAVVNFYPSGRLKFYFAPQNTTVQGIPCKGGLLRGIELHENGKLKSCTVTEEVNFKGRTFEKGDRLNLDNVGDPVQ